MFMTGIQMCCPSRPCPDHNKLSRILCSSMERDIIHPPDIPHTHIYTELQTSAYTSHTLTNTHLHPVALKLFTFLPWDHCSAGILEQPMGAIVTECRNRVVIPARQATYTVKKRFAIFPSPAGMSLIKLYPAGNNLIIPGLGEFGQ